MRLIQKLLIYIANYDFLKIASRILFIEMVKILNNTKKSPNQPKITATESKLEPRSRCSKFCIYFELIHFTLHQYLLK